MKIIFSRKGFDGSSGCCASPIIDGEHLLSLPIPYPKQETRRRFGHIRFGDVSLGTIVAARTRSRLSDSDLCHLDPDLRASSLPKRRPKWTPLFGQANKAGRHLDNEGVGPGDVFLFFGWFRRCDGWATHAAGSRNLHVLFGWLQVGDVITNPTDWVRSNKWAEDHPHTYGDWEVGTNRIYVASDDLKIGRSRIPGKGAGTFDTFHPDLQLTHPEARSRSAWRLPRCFAPTEGRRAITTIEKGTWTEDGDFVRVQPRGNRWQEAVYDATDDATASKWVRDLIRRHGS